MTVKPSVSRSNDTKKAKFLSALTQGQSVKEAAAYGGFHRRTAYDWRDQDASFGLAWQEAIDESIEELEDEVRARALDRTDKMSHILLMFLLKKHKPEYRENHKREVTVKHEKVQEFTFSQTDMDDALEILQKAKNPETTQTTQQDHEAS